MFHLSSRKCSGTWPTPAACITIHSEAVILMIREAQEHRLCMRAKLLQLCPTLCIPMDCSLPGTSAHGIIQARRLEWIANSFSRVFSWPRDWTLISHISSIGRQAGSLPLVPPRKPRSTDYCIRNSGIRMEEGAEKGEQRHTARELPHSTSACIQLARIDLHGHTSWEIKYLFWMATSLSKLGCSVNWEEGNRSWRWITSL